MRLPMLGTRAVADRPSHAPTDGAAILQGSTALTGVNLLVVDDDQDARDLISTTLRQAGANVVAAASMHEALARLRESVPQALVSDIAMPNGTGYELVRHVRATAESAKIPAIALTAFGRAEDRARALEAGFNFHMTKPVDPHHLVHVVMKALRG